MLKIINPLVAKEVGVMASMVFQHICYWMQTQSVDVVYRSNKELSLDLDEAVSVSQVQRAKQKLLDKGLIKLSRNPFNKFDRTTHYSLTSKGKKMLLSVAVKGKQIVSETKQITSETKETINETVKEVKSKIEDVPESLKTSSNSSNKEVVDTYVPEKPKTSNTSYDSVVQQPKKQWIPKHLYAEHMKQKRLDEQLNKEPFIPKSMIKGWEDGMTGNHDATKGIPEHLLNNPVIAKMLKMKGKYTQKQCVSQSDEVTTMQDMSEEHSIDNHKQQENTPSLSNLMKGCFDKGFTDDQEKLYSMKINQQHFVEDY